jgi:hypothetical protein
MLSVGSYWSGILVCGFAGLVTKDGYIKSEVVNRIVARLENGR